MSFRQTAIALMLLSAALPALAQRGGTWSPGEVGFVADPPKSTLTREHVQKEFLDFIKRGGRIAAGDQDYFDPATEELRTTTLTREQVRQDLVDFLQRGGRIASGDQDYFDPATLNARTTALTREQVKQDLLQFLNRGGQHSVGGPD